MASKSHYVFPEVKQSEIFVLKGIVEERTREGHPPIDLSVGAYRTEGGEPYIFKSVLAAEKIISEGESTLAYNKEYLGIAGLGSFTEEAPKLVFGKKSKIYKDKNYKSVQTLSGTGALFLAISALMSTLKDVVFHLPNSTWPNHLQIISNLGGKYEFYPYIDPETGDLDFDGMVAYFEGLDTETPHVPIFHSVCHNPTGIDLSDEQWDTLAEIFKKRGDPVIFDVAYQGLGSGSMKKDSYSVRRFVEAGVEMFVCQSFAKIMGLYGERIGCVTFVGNDLEDVRKMGDVLKYLVRSVYSNPPKHGGEIASIILNDKELLSDWKKELKEKVYSDLKKRREKFADEMIKLDKKHADEWEKIRSQSGMFSIMNILSKEDVYKLRDSNVIMPSNRRICFGSLKMKEIAPLCEKLNEVLNKEE